MQRREQGTERGRRTGAERNPQGKQGGQQHTTPLAENKVHTHLHLAEQELADGVRHKGGNNRYKSCDDAHNAIFHSQHSF